MLSIPKRKLRTFAAKSHQEHGLFFEAYLRMGLARACVLTLPFRWLSRNWGTPQYEEFRYSHAGASLQFLRQLNWAIRTASKYTPWKSNCLAQAIAAKKILRRRGYTSTLYLGMTTPSAREDGKIEAHAWLRCGDTWICGLRASRGFTVVATYAELKEDLPMKKIASPDMGETIAKLR